MEELTYLVRSETRPAVLERLRDEGPCTRRGLREHVGASRSTLVRCLDRMAEFGWVRETGDDRRRYRVTALGAFVADAFERVRGEFETADALSAFLERVPADEFDLDPRLLADARVTGATPAEPLAPVDRVTEIRAASETVRECSSVVARDSAEQVRDRAERDDGDHEIILTADVVASLTDGSDYGESFEAARDHVDFRVYDGEFPFLLALLDDRVALGVVDENDRPVALVESTDPEVYAWAEERYCEYRAAAEPLPGSASPERQ